MAAADDDDASATPPIWLPAVKGAPSSDHIGEWPRDSIDAARLSSAVDAFDWSEAFSGRLSAAAEADPLPRKAAAENDVTAAVEEAAVARAGDVVAS